jgi:hypothetical protein
MKKVRTVKRLFAIFLLVILILGLFIVASVSDVKAQPYALYCSQEAQGVRVPDSVSLDITGPLTVEAWVKPDASLYDELFNFIVSKNMSGTAYTLLTVGWDSGKLAEAADSTYPPPINEWIHLVGVWSGGSNKLYINGQLEAEELAPNPPLANDFPLYIGWSPFGDNTNWRGVMDEVRIWNVARTEDQILAHMYTELNGNESGLAAYWDFNDGPGSTIATDRSGNGNHGTLISGASSPLPQWVVSDAPVSPIPEPSAKPPLKPGNPGLPGCLAEVAELRSQAIVPQTGQTDSYVDYDDGYHKTGVPWPIPRFTKNEDGTVTDNLTKLVWLENAKCRGGKTWAEAINFCNSLESGTCGLTDGSNPGDWRLPSINEMVSLIHWGVYNPAIPNTMGTGQLTEGNPFINVDTAGHKPHYWTSTTYFYPPPGTEAFCVPFSSGGIDELPKTEGLNVWCVKGGN